VRKIVKIRQTDVKEERSLCQCELWFYTLLKKVTSDNTWKFIRKVFGSNVWWNTSYSDRWVWWFPSPYL